MMQKKKNRVKIFLESMFVMILLFGIMPGRTGMVWAEEKYDLHLGSLRATSENCNQMESRHWKYDHKSHTLTLNSYEWDGADETNGNEYDINGISYTGNSPLRIVLLGDNRIQSRSTTGIYSSAPLVFQGNGSLYVKSGSTMRINERTFGIKCDSGITVNSGTITVEGGATANMMHTTTGISATSVTVNGGKLTAKGGEIGYRMNMSTGVSGNITVYGGELTAEGGYNASEDSKSYGLMGDLTIPAVHGKVTVIGYDVAIWANYLLYNEAAGMGWTDVKGTGSGTLIDSHPEGIDLYENNFKKIVFDDVLSWALTFHPNGAPEHEYIQRMPLQGSAPLFENRFTYEGHTFIGWNTKADGTGQAYADKQEMEIHSDQVLYAQWLTNVTLTANSETLTYDGEKHTVSGYTASVENLKFQGVSAAGSGKDAGDHTVSFAGVTPGQTKDLTGKYLVTEAVTGKLTIEPKSIAGASVTLSETRLVYNGARQQIEVTGVTVGSLTLTKNDYEMTGDTAGTDADSYRVTVQGKGNFKDSVTAVWEITEKGMSVSAEPYHSVYDGEGHGITVKVTDPAEGAVVKYGTEKGKCSQTASPVIKNAGTLTVYYTVQAKNYSEASGSAVVTVVPKEVTVEANPAGKRFGEKDPGLTATVAGTLPGETVQYTVTRAVGEDIGEYVITPEGEKNQGNYTVTYRTAVFTIHEAAEQEPEPAEPTTQADQPTEPTKQAEEPEEPTKQVEEPAEPTKQAEEPAEPTKQTEEPEEPTKKEENAGKKENVKLALEKKFKITFGEDTITVRWGKAKSVDGYLIYAAYCGSGKPQLIKTIKKKTTTRYTIRKLNGKKINPKKCVKIYVAGYQKQKGKKAVLGKTVTGHVPGKALARYTDIKKVTLKKTNYRLKAGKTADIKASVVLKTSGLKTLDRHNSALRYYSDNKKVAKVSSSGKITAVKKGSCSIYVYAVNGMWVKANVTVK